MTKGTSLAITIVSSSIGGLLLGGLLVYAFMRSNEPDVIVVQSESSDSMMASDETAAVNTPESKSDSARAGWKTYQDPSYFVDFEYPPSWGEAEIFDQTESFFYDLVYNSVEFKPGEADYRTLQISTIPELEALDSDVITDSVSALKTVYASRSANSVSVPPLPIPYNAGIFYNTDPTYVESSNGVYRGVYYFAQIGNGVPQVGPDVQLPALVMVMTNGVEVIQFTTDMGADIDAVDISYFGTYSEAAKTCNVGFPDALGNERCLLADELVKDLNDNYLPLAESLR